MSGSISEIKARYADSGLGAEEYKKLTIAEIAQIRLDIKRVLKKYDELEAKKEAVEKERDAAVEDMRIIITTENGMCDICKHESKDLDEPPCYQAKDSNVGCEGFEWRGPKEGEEGEER